MIAPKELTILSQDIQLLENTSIDATNNTGGGQVYIGTSHEEQNLSPFIAETVYIAPGAQIDASAQLEGNGGKVILWSHQNTQVYGEILAEGGKEKGDGGFVEISSYGLLNPSGHVSTKAPFGRFGTLLLDPTNVTISTGADSGFTAAPPPSAYNFNANTATINVGNLVGLLGANNIIIDAGTGTGAAASGTILVVNNVLWNAPTSLTLQATGANDSITLQAGLQNTDATLGTTDCIVVTSPTITLGDPLTDYLVTLSATSGNIRLNASQTLTLYSSTLVNQLDSSATAGSIFLTGDGVGGITTILETPGNPVRITTAAGNISLSSTNGPITLGQETVVESTNGGQIDFTCPNGKLWLQTINAIVQGGPITINADSLQLDDHTQIVSSGAVGCTVANTASFNATANQAFLSAAGDLTFSAKTLNITGATTGSGNCGLFTSSGTLSCTVTGTATLTGAGISPAMIRNTAGDITFNAGTLTIIGGNTTGPNGITADAGNLTCTVTNDITLNAGSAGTAQIQITSPSSAKTLTVTSTNGNILMSGGINGGTENGARIDTGWGDVIVSCPNGGINMDLTTLGSSFIDSGVLGHPGSVTITLKDDFTVNYNGGNGEVHSYQENVNLNIGGSFNLLGGPALSNGVFFLESGNHITLSLGGDFNVLHNTTTPFVTGPTGGLFCIAQGGLTIQHLASTPGVSNMTLIGVQSPGPGFDAETVMLGSTVDILLPGGNITLTNSADGPVILGGGLGIPSGYINVSANNIILNGDSALVNSPKIGIGGIVFTTPIPGEGTVTINATGDLTLGINATVSTFGHNNTNDITINAKNIILDSDSLPATNSGGSIVTGQATGTAPITGGGAITINVTESLLMNGQASNPTLIQMSATSVGQMQILAGQNIELNSPDIIEALNGGDVIIVVDNTPPYNVSPNIGPGLLVLSEGAAISNAGGVLRIYGAVPGQTTIDPTATLNGSALSPNFEEIGIWYPGTGTGTGIPYTLYFKAAVRPVNPTTTALQRLSPSSYARFQTAVSEALQEWNFFDPYYELKVIDLVLTYKSNGNSYPNDLSSFDVFKSETSKFLQRRYQTYNTLKFTPFF